MKDKLHFHPYQLNFCGHSGAGKTTLISKLVERLSDKYKVGYLKHDAHQFEMDKAGKDTHTIKYSGAHSIGITSNSKTAYISDSEDLALITAMFVDHDLLLVEGFKKSLGPKIVMLSGNTEDEKLLETFIKDENVIAFIGDRSKVNDHNVIDRNDIDSIHQIVESFFLAEAKKVPLYGLILGGGKSKRMGMDKSALTYHRKPQAIHLYDQLSMILDQVFISCRQDQMEQTHLYNLPRITDNFLNVGPLGGLLSAQNIFPNAAWLVIACDMPFIERENLLSLIEKRNPFKTATCFYNKDKNWPEPLLTIYEPKTKIRAMQFLGMGKTCPRKLLMNSSIEQINPEHPQFLANVNTSEDYKNTVLNLRQRGLR